MLFRSLTRLAKSKDMRVQRNATGALLNMTHSGAQPCRPLDQTRANHAHATQTRTGSSSSTLEPYLSSSSFCRVPTRTCSTTARPRSATLRSMVRFSELPNCAHELTRLPCPPCPAMNRRKLSTTEPKLVANLITLMDSPSLKVQCQAALALRNLASDGATCVSQHRRTRS